MYRIVVKRVPLNTNARRAQHGMICPVRDIELVTDNVATVVYIGKQNSSMSTR